MFTGNSSLELTAAEDRLFLSLQVASSQGKINGNGFIQRESYLSKRET